MQDAPAREKPAMTEGNAEGSSIPPLTPDLARRDRNAHSRRRRAASGLLFGSRAPGDAVVVFPVKGVVVWTPAEVEAWHAACVHHDGASRGSNAVRSSIPEHWICLDYRVARKPRETAVISEIDSVVKHGGRLLPERRCQRTPGPLREPPDTS
jgi:hypothetical protein